MIIVFSNNLDPATLDVTKWLRFYGAPFARINSDDKDIPTPRIRFENDMAEIEFESRWISLTDVTAIWYRKGNFWRHEAGQRVDVPQCNALSQNINGHLKWEADVARDYFHYLVKKRGIKVLGNASLGDSNKLIVLDMARDCGLNVPHFHLTERIHGDFADNPDSYITKPVSNGMYFWDIHESSRGYFSYTEQLSDINLRGRAVPLSLIQKKVKKKFEVRSFYLDGQFLSCAIFSQLDSRTTVDYRKYNYIRPNRNLPYDMPADIEEKLTELFHRLDLNTGSVDLIVDEQDQHYFLEINPSGQYTGISNRCNFGIDLSIAQWLMGER